MPTKSNRMDLMMSLKCSQHTALQQTTQLFSTLVDYSTVPYFSRLLNCSLLQQTTQLFSTLVDYSTVLYFSRLLNCSLLQQTTQLFSTLVDYSTVLYFSRLLNCLNLHNFDSCANCWISPFYEYVRYRYAITHHVVLKRHLQMIVQSLADCSIEITKLSKLLVFDRMKWFILALTLKYKPTIHTLFPTIHYSTLE